MKTRKSRKRKKPDLVRLLCSCGKRVKVSLKFAGKTGKCPKCGKQIKIPALEKIEKELRRSEENQLYDIPSIPSLKEIVLEDKNQQSGSSSDIIKTETESSKEVLAHTAETVESPQAVEVAETPEIAQTITAPEEIIEEKPMSVVAEPLVASFAEPSDEEVTMEFDDAWEDPVNEELTQHVTEGEIEPEWEAMPVGDDGGVPMAMVEEVEEAADAVQVEEAMPVEDEIESFEDIEELTEESSYESEISIEELDSQITIAEEISSNIIEALQVSEEEEQRWDQDEDDETPAFIADEGLEDIVGGELLLQGKQALIDGNLEEALHCFTTGVNSLQDMGAAHYLRAVYYLRMESWHMALIDLQQAEKNGYDRQKLNLLKDQVMFSRASYFSELGAYDRALKDLDQITSADISIEKGKIYWQRAKYFMKGRVWDLALKDIEQSLHHHYLKPHIYEAGGRISLCRREYESAMNYFTAAINRGGDDAFLFHGRGEANFFLENFEEALSDIQHAREMEPDNSAMQDLEGLVLNELKQYQEADQAFERSLGLTPDNSYHYYNRAIAYMRRGRYDLAAQDFTKVIRSNDKDREAYLKRAISLQEKTNPDLLQARKDFQKVEDLDQKNLYRGGFSSSDE